MPFILLDQDALDKLAVMQAQEKLVRLVGGYQVACDLGPERQILFHESWRS